MFPPRLRAPSACAPSLQLASVSKLLAWLAFLPFSLHLSVPQEPSASADN